MREATRLAESGQVMPKLDARRFTLANAGEAHELIANRQSMGKLVVDVG
jgi:NADPH2:quinone reductase